MSISLAAGPVRRRGAVAVGALCMGVSVAAALSAMSAPAALAGPGTVETTTRYEAEDYPGTVGSNTADGTCSNGSRRGSAMTTGPLVSIPITVPADVISLSVKAHGRAAATASPAFSISGGWDGTVSAPVNASGTCDLHSDFAPWNPYPMLAGSRTLTITPAGGVALTLDYVEVTISVPEPTTTTSSTTTTTEITTTTTTPTTTTTIPGDGDDGLARSGRAALAWIISLLSGLLSGWLLFFGGR